MDLCIVVVQQIPQKPVDCNIEASVEVICDFSQMHISTEKLPLAP